MQKNRRQFLRDSLGTPAALSVAPMFVPRSAWGANERPTYGVIGAGGRGRYLNRTFQQLGCQCVAVCDVYQPNFDLALKDSPGVKTYWDYNDMLTQSPMDFVVVGTPDHQHAPNLFACLKAKKDVYLEKPMSHSLEESVRMVKAVRATDRIVQIGMQRRSAPVIHMAQKLIEQGMLGRVTMVKPQWHWNIARPLNNTPLAGELDWGRFLGPAPKVPMEPKRFRSWRLFWDYSGGNMTDQGTHLMDVVQWFTGNEPPRTAVCDGQIAKSDGSEAPDVFCAVFGFPKMMATWTLDYCNAYQNGWSILFMGDEGTMLVDEDGFTVWKEPWNKNPEPIIKVKLAVPLESHVQNFLDCIKSRNDPNAPVEVGMKAVAGAHLANIAFKQKRQVTLGADNFTVS